MTRFLPFDPASTLGIHSQIWQLAEIVRCGWVTCCGLQRTITLLTVSNLTGSQVPTQAKQLLYQNFASCLHQCGSIVDTQWVVSATSLSVSYLVSYVTFKFEFCRVDQSSVFVVVVAGIWWLEGNSSASTFIGLGGNGRTPQHGPSGRITQK